MINSIKNKKMFVGLIISTFTIVSCGGVKFDTKLDSDTTSLSAGEFFAYSSKVETFKQDELLENQVTMSFQAFDKDGLPLSELKKSDLALSENNNIIENYSLNAMSSVVTKADIVFVIDKTGSMGDEINGIKENVREFVNKLRSVNILANLCLVTFNDRVKDECLSFQADDPNTSTNENLDNFLDRLERVQAKGGGDDNENQLAGLMSAAQKTPWRPEAQRITILMTDENFSHSGNPGHAGGSAKSYAGTYATLKSERIINYIVGPKLPGYSAPFDGTPALALQENFFNIEELIESNNAIFESEKESSSDEKDLGDILAAIASSLSTEYTITYNISENNLNPTLPINSRNVKLDITTLIGSKLELKPLKSTQPNGQEFRRRSWTVGHDIDTNREMKIYVNNELINEDNYMIVNKTIIFNEAPTYSALIKVIYESVSISGGLQLRQIKLAIPDSDNTNLVVYFNGVKADPADYVTAKQANGIYTLLSVVPSAMNNDKYLIKENGGMNVTFDTVAK